MTISILQVKQRPLRTEAIPAKDGAPETLSSSRATVTMTTVECSLSQLPFRVAPPCWSRVTQNGHLSTDENYTTRAAKSLSTDRFALQDLLFHRLQPDLLQDDSRTTLSSSAAPENLVEPSW